MDIFSKWTDAEKAWARATRLLRLSNLRKAADARIEEEVRRRMYELDVQVRIEAENAPHVPDVYDPEDDDL